MFIVLIRKKTLDNLKKEAILAYELGWRMGQIEKGNKGFIMAGVMNVQLDKILRQKGAGSL